MESRHFESWSAPSPPAPPFRPLILKCLASLVPGHQLNSTEYCAPIWLGFPFLGLNARHSETRVNECTLTYTINKYGRIPILTWGVGGNRSARRKSTEELANQIHIQPWLAALVKGKCSNIKTASILEATGGVCHPDTERNRPYKIPWPSLELNRGPTAPQARTLPVYQKLGQ